MKLFLTIFLFSLVIAGCENQASLVTPSLEGITLKTDKNVYSDPDSILLKLTNNSGDDIELGFRCSLKNLEMFYQQKEKDEWSENRWFTYMNLKCMTILSKLENKKVLQNTLSTTQFDTKGTFRLLVTCYIAEKDTNVVVVSNSFEIK